MDMQGNRISRQKKTTPKNNVVTDIEHKGKGRTIMGQERRVEEGRQSNQEKSYTAMANIKSNGSKGLHQNLQFT